MIIDPAGLRPIERYRLLISAVVPRPIAFVTSRGRAGVLNLAPFSFFQGVSASPPTVSLAVARRRDGRPKDTWRNISETGEYVIHSVTEKMLDPVLVAAADWPEDESEVERTGLATAPSECVAVPRLRDAPLAMECRRHWIQEIHGVALIVGEVVRFHVDDSIRPPGGAPEVDFLRLGAVARLGGDDYVHGGSVISRPRRRLEDLR